jgi:serine/threonine-protein kinase
MIGDLIDHYRVLELVGRGAMGVVYKALDVNLDRPVAIKVMSAEARNDPSFVERFRQEACAQAALNHPNVAQLFDYFVHDGAPVAVMEFIDGESMEQLIRRRGAIRADESIPMFKQALRGVAAAHRAGIIHRDLKPGNLMITKDDIVKVMDFGIAKRQGVTGATKASTSIGSPFYMAPEQILGRAVDCRTDIYALGITLYELLSGQRPFNPHGKASEYLVLNAHVNDTPEPPTVYRYGIPQPIVDAVMRALAKDPDARFQSADEFMCALPDLPRAGPSGTVAPPQVAPSDTVTLEYSPLMSRESVNRRQPSGTIVLEQAPSTRRDPGKSMAFDYSAATVLQEFHPPASSAPTASPAEPSVAASPRDSSIPSSPAPSPKAPVRQGASPARVPRLRASIIVAVLVALVAGVLAHRAERLHAIRGDASLVANGPQKMQPPALPPGEAPMSTATAAPPPAPSPAAEPPAQSVEVAPVTAASTAPMNPATTAPGRPDLSGTWRGEYVDASGKEVLRVVSLSISRVEDDGGIEGTLHYRAASGDGECKLHPRGSAYSAGEQRLQLSPEGCSPRYPRELGVPLDFDGVNPRADTLQGGRIEAPTGEVIRVTLKRVRGA